MMEVRAKKSLGQHFLTDQGIARSIVDALKGRDVLEVGPGMGVLTQYLLPRSFTVQGENSEVPGTGSPASGESPTAPGRDPLLPGESPTNPGRDPILPGESPTAPGRDSFLPGESPTASGRDPLLPGESPTAPGRDPLLPGESPTAPGKDSSLPGENPTAPGRDPLLPGESPTGHGQGSTDDGPAKGPGCLKVVEIDKESVAYLKKHYPGLGSNLIEGDFLKMDLDTVFPGKYSVIGNFPYNISSQIFFKILEHKDKVPEVVCMIQKEVAERIAEKPGTKAYGILSVFLQAWYDIDYLFTVGSGAFNPPPKVQSAVIRLTRNSRTSLGCDENLFRAVVKTSFGQRRKTLRNSLKPLYSQGLFSGKSCPERASRPGATTGAAASSPGHTRSEDPAFDPRPGLDPLHDPVFDLRPERLGVEDFVRLTLMLQQ